MSVQADYLKKYLSADDGEKKKKRKKKVKALKHDGIKIEIDDAFAMVKPKSGFSSGSDDDEEDEELRNAAMKNAGGFFATTFAEVGDKAGTSTEQRTSNGKESKNGTAQISEVSDESPPRRGQHQDSDESPPRSRHGQKELSPRRRSDSDASPRRRHASPPKRRGRGRSSPRRRRDSRSSTPDRSPPRRRQRRDSDAAPTRSGKRGGSTPDRSPPRRRQRRDSDAAPPRSKHGSKKTSASPDRSPPRRRDSDAYPPRSRRSPSSKRRNADERRRRSPESGAKSPAQKVKDKYTGLLTREQMREKTRRDAEVIDKHLEDLAESGRGAEAVHRIRAGPDGKKRRITKEDEARNEREAAKQKEINEKFSSISKGVAQAEDRAERNKEMERTLQEGFTRHADDEAMNEHLRDQLLGEDDPLNEYFEKKNMKIKMQSELVYPTYRGHFAPNRYQIRPGYRWDGVDRSNGFESKLSNRENEQRAREAMTYRIMAELAE